MTDLGRYNAALDYLAGRIDYERSPPKPALRGFNLDRMRRLLSLLDDPQDAVRIVHLAGTKGKGSTASMIARSLTAAGYRTGLFTSPHLSSIEQRWTVDGAVAPRDELPELVEAVRPAVERLDHEADSAGEGLGRPTFFEFTTAMALLHFQRQGCSAAVLEVGLGGRLDSTNVCRPEITVITTISFDHMHLLGDTLAAIAREKAGIVKPGVPLVTGVVQPEPRRVIEAIARERSAPLAGAGSHFQYAYRRSNGTGSASFDYWETAPTGERMDDVRLGMFGEHQAANGATALATLRWLARRGWTIDEAAMRRGLAAAFCPARIETFPGATPVVLDAAHNVASVEALVKVLEDEYAGRSGRLVFAVSADKDVDGILRRLAPRFTRLELTRFLKNPRSVPPEELARTVRRVAPEWSGELRVWDDPHDAWESAWKSAGPGEFLCVAGSFFLAGELRDAIVRATAESETKPERGSSENAP